LIANGVLKIADFGFSFIYDPSAITENTDIFQTYLGSPLFMAPEVLLQKRYSLKSDIYSLGVMFYLML
jgi:serine/threonine protein kinase